MNIRKIVTYNALRKQFTAEELALADVLYNATESERELLANALQPEKPATKKAGKAEPRKIQHCAVCNWTKRAALHKDTTRSDYHEFVSSEPGKSNGKSVSKSSRATSLSSQLKSRVSEQREAATKDDDDGDDEDGPRCTYVMGDDARCNETEHSPVHSPQGGYLNWHDFQPRKSSTTAPSATPRSSPKPAPARDDSYGVNSKDVETVSA